MINRYIVAAITVMFIVFLAYIIKFYFMLGYAVSDDTATWGQFGDYAGGLLNPALSFISLVLLIKSLTLQNETNRNLRTELQRNEKSEKIRSFETLFFNMIHYQKELFDSLTIEFAQGKEQVIKRGVEVVIKIEDEVERIKKETNDDKEILSFLEKIDSKDQIFGITRAFYITVKMISDKLNNAQGFDIEDRKSHLLALINFTAFAQLRLIMISLQFMNYQSVEYLKNDKEFNNILQEVNLSYTLY